MSNDEVARKLRGLGDYSVPQAIELRRWIDDIRSTYSGFGFVPLEARPFERADALSRQGGIGKQIFGVYRLVDGQHTEFALPFDRTVPFALWVVRHLHSVTLPLRRSDIALSFRGERPQAGRFLAFRQADVDIVGRNLGLTSDTECISAVYHALDRLPIGNFTLLLNHQALARGLVAAAGIAEEAVPTALTCIDKLDRAPREEVAAELRGELVVHGFPCPSSEALGKCLEAFAYVGPIDTYDPRANEGMVTQALQRLGALVDMLRATGIPSSRIMLAPARVRGLNYYSGAVFETILEGHSKYGSIASGGRYDRLVGSLSSRVDLADIQGVGGSIGVTRLFDIACREGWVGTGISSVADVLVVPRTDDLSLLALGMGQRLRAKGVAVEVGDPNLSVSRQLTRASRMGIPLALLVLSERELALRELGTGDQTEASNSDAAIDAVSAQLRRLGRPAAPRPRSSNGSGVTP